MNDTSLGPHNADQKGIAPELFYEEAPDILHGGKEALNGNKRKQMA